MEFKGKYSIPATPDRVFEALRQPEMLAAAIPGCEGVERTSDTEYRARTTIKIGPVKARLRLSITPGHRSSIPPVPAGRRIGAFWLFPSLSLSGVLEKDRPA